MRWWYEIFLFTKNISPSLSYFLSPLLRKCALRGYSSSCHLGKYQHFPQQHIFSWFFQFLTCHVEHILSAVHICVDACVRACLKIHSLLYTLCVKMARRAVAKVWQFCGQNGMRRNGRKYRSEKGRRRNGPRAGKTEWVYTHKVPEHWLDPPYYTEFFPLNLWCHWTNCTSSFSQRIFFRLAPFLQSLHTHSYLAFPNLCALICKFRITFQSMYVILCVHVCENDCHYGEWVNARAWSWRWNGTCELQASHVYSRNGLLA